MRLLPLQPLAAGPNKWPSFWFVLGVLLPVFVIFEELVYGGCVSIMDPMPTWAHVPLLSLVPASNYAAYRMLVRGETAPSTPMRWLLGGGMGVMTFYALLCWWVSLEAALVAPVGLAISVIVGFGPALAVVLGLSPVIMFLGTRRWHSSFSKGTPYHLSGAVAVALLLLADVPQRLQQKWIFDSLHDPDAMSRLANVENLRNWGDPRLILRQCYSPQPFPCPLDSLLSGQPLGPFSRLAGSRPKRIDSDHAKALFFRVTGTAFSDHAPEARYSRGDITEGKRDTLDGFVWDR